jgi:hypothetical protein
MALSLAMRWQITLPSLVRFTLVCLGLGMLPGCVGSSPPAPAGKDTWMPSNNGGFSYATGAELEGDLLRRADSFCRDQGRQLQPVSTHSGDAGFNTVGHASLYFRCLSDNDPGLGRPTLRAAPNVVIENC